MPAHHAAPPRCCVVPSIRDVMGSPAPSPWQPLLLACADAAAGVRHDCPASPALSPLAACGPALVDLLSRQAQLLCAIYGLATSEAPANPDPDSDPGRGHARAGADPLGRKLLAKRLEDILSIAYAKFYAFPYKNLPICWRQLYTDASILKFCLLAHDLAHSGSEPPPVSDGQDDQRAESGRQREDGLSCLAKPLDLAIILAGAAGQQRGRRWIDRAFDLLTDLQASLGGPGSHRLKPLETRASPRANIGDEFSRDEPFTPPVTRPIRVVDALGMEAFQKHLDTPTGPGQGPEPLVIRGTLADWPALTSHPWRQPSYLLSQTLGGRRLVPVEIGRSYVDDGWGQQLVPFGDFLAQYIERPSLPQTVASPTATATGYLAQHQLFAQLPSLRRDILVPDYCYTSPPEHPLAAEPGFEGFDLPELDEPLLNAWLGPPGTITPLHNDPYHNILAQVVGRKYVRLYAPGETWRMRARGVEDGGVHMGNTSLVDVGVVEGWDAAPEPSPGVGDADAGGEEGDKKGIESGEQEFRDVPYLDYILGPGDVLYIPIGWWHYVRGLSVSFSVSFWWN